MKKTMKLAAALLMSLVLLLGVTGYAEEQDIVGIAAGNENFSILVTALQKAELVEALQGEGPFTVFAPTNAAFEALLGALGITAEDLLNHPQLADVLLYHVVSGKVMSTDLSNGMMAETLSGQKITVDLTNGVKINSSTVTTADIVASNGVIHVIDTVLVPETFQLAPAAEALPSIVDIAVGSEDFSILVAALQKAELVEALQGEGPFTVFAPTNAAFEALLGALGITAEDLLNHPQLVDVLLYHVVSGKVMSTDLQNGMTAETLGGMKIMVDLTEGVRINTSNVTAADIEASNGVIHVIDKVLVPYNFRLAPAAEALPSIVDIAVGSEDFSILVAALQKAELVEALQGEGPFTVFAPTNAAFEALLESLDLTAEELLNNPQLADVLLYHVVSGKVMSTDLQNGMTAETFGGQMITVDLTNGVKINSSTVTTADISASNGVIHAIDTVLVPATFRLQGPEVEYRALTVGDHGSEVIQLKQRFYDLGYFRTSKFNNRFTENTADAVRRFEEINGLPVDGIADVEMLKLINSKDAKRP